MPSAPRRLPAGSSSTPPTRPDRRRGQPPARRPWPQPAAERRPRPAWLKFFDQFRSVLIIILLGAAVLALGKGQTAPLKRNLAHSPKLDQPVSARHRHIAREFADGHVEQAGPEGSLSQPATAHSGSPTAGSQASRQALGPSFCSQSSTLMWCLEWWYFVGHPVRTVTDPPVQCTTQCVARSGDQDHRPEQFGVELTTPKTTGSEPSGSNGGDE